MEAIVLKVISSYPAKEKDLRAGKTSLLNCGSENVPPSSPYSHAALSERCSSDGIER
jgi:hypothetical protein